MRKGELAKTALRKVYDLMSMGEDGSERVAVDPEG